MASAATLRRQARAEAILRTSPQAAILREMLAQAISDRNTGLAATTGATRGVTRAITSAEPGIRAVYDNAIKQGGTISDTVKSTLEGMGAPASTIQAAIAREGGVGQNRLSESLAAALSGLASQKVEAAAGGAYGTRSTLSQYASEKDKILRQASDLAGQQGLYASTRYGELAGAQDKQNFTARENARNRRNARTVAGVDATGQVIPGGPKDKPKGAATLTPAEQRQRAQVYAGAKDAIAQAQVWIDRFRGGSKPMTDQQIKNLLATGAPAKSVTKDVPVIDPLTKKVKVDARGQAMTRTETVPGEAVPKLDPDFIKAAIELKDQGYLSPDTVHALRGRKIHVGKDWLPIVVKPHLRKPVKRVVNKGAQQLGQTLSGALG